MISTVYSILSIVSFIYNIYSIYKPPPPPASSSIFSSMGWRMSGLARISCFSLSAAATILSLVIDTLIVLYSKVQNSTVQYSAVQRSYCPQGEAIVTLHVTISDDTWHCTAARD